MELFKGRLRRVGSSLGVLVPKRTIRDLNVREGDEVEVAVLPPREERRARLERVIGSLPRLGRFSRERKDRY